MGNHFSQQKKKGNISSSRQLRASRYQQCQDYGVSVISGCDPASLQGVRNVTHDIEELPNEIPDIKENPPSPCPAFPRRIESSQTAILKNSYENPDYLTTLEVLNVRDHHQSDQSVSRTEINGLNITSTGMTDDGGGAETNDNMSLSDDVDVYATIHPKSSVRKPHAVALADEHTIGWDNPEYFRRGSFPRMSERTNSSKDSAFTADTSASGHTSSKDYICVNCSVCRPQQIEFMVDVYKKRLQMDLRVEDLLKDIHCIDDLYKEEIERRSKESRQAAVDMLLGHIRHSSEQGKWQNFIEALDNNGYSAIVKLLKSETENDTEDKRKLLALMSRQLVYNIHVDEFLDLLFEAELLNEADKENVESEKRNNGLLAAAHKIFNIVPTKSHEWVQRLTDILKKCGLGDVAELLSFSEDRQMSPATDETDLKKVKCNHNHKKFHYDANHHSNSRYRHEMHYETIHNRVSSTYDVCKTTRVINELGHHIKVIEGKADLHSSALKELTDAQQKDINELKRNFNDLTNMVEHLRNQDFDIEKELTCQRALIQNMEKMHRQEFSDLKKSLSEIRSLISDLTKAVSPSPPEACKIAINGCTADSGFSGGLGSIPEDDYDSEINSEFGILGLEENCTKL